MATTSAPKFLAPKSKPTIKVGDLVVDHFAAAKRTQTGRESYIDGFLREKQEAAERVQQERQEKRIAFQAEQVSAARVLAEPQLKGHTAKRVANLVFDEFPLAVAIDGKSQTTVAIENAINRLSASDLAPEKDKSVKYGINAARRCLTKAYDQLNGKS